MKESKSRVLEISPAKPKEAKRYFNSKLEFECDAFDVHEDMKKDLNGFVLLDARRPESFHTEHIKGAVHFWHASISKKTVKTLSKKEIYVIYCAGVGCNAATKAAAKLSKLGFRVKEMIGGIQWWKEQGYPVQKGKR
jgi:rhodanese-related sulfurtransferase